MKSGSPVENLFPSLFKRKERVQSPAGTAAESPVAESIQGGGVAICQWWEQRIPTLVGGSSRPLLPLVPGLESVI